MNKRNIFAIISFILFLILIIIIKMDLIIPFDNAAYSFVTFNMNEGLTRIYNFITFLGNGVFIAAIYFSILIGAYFSISSRKDL